MAARMLADRTWLDMALHELAVTTNLTADAESNLRRICGGAAMGLLRAGIEDMASAGCGCAEIVAEMGRLGVGIEVETLRRYMANNRITISNGGKV